jgi:DNA-binding PadR family transcriptional regulator
MASMAPPKLLKRAQKPLTDAELLVLGLVSEKPRHGYELEQVIEQRNMREWTEIGFSSIYFVLGKLENMGLAAGEKGAEAKARKVYAITKLGRRTLAAQTAALLKTVHPPYSSVLPGMLHWPVLDRDAALEALHARGEAVAAESERLAGIQIDQQPLPDFVDALFDFALGQLKAEAEWIARTLDYMNTKPWPL